MPAISSETADMPASHGVSSGNGTETLQRWLLLPPASVDGDGGDVDADLATVGGSYDPLRIESLVAASAEELAGGIRDMTAFDTFDEDDNLFGSSLAFDASAGGLWHGRFVPPPPRPPFFVDEPVLHDGLTTCDLCSWAMPTKSTFIFKGTIEKASELGWPLTLIIVSILSAVLGAIVMITVVRCRRRKTANNRNETQVQWWSRHKRSANGNGSASASGDGGGGGGSGGNNNNNNNNNHLRRSNIYTSHPADGSRPALAAVDMGAMTSTLAEAGVSVSQPPLLPHRPQRERTQQQQRYARHRSQQQQQQQQHEHNLNDSYVDSDAGECPQWRGGSLSTTPQQGPMTAPISRGDNG